MGGKHASRHLKSVNLTLFVVVSSRRFRKPRTKCTSARTTVMLALSMSLCTQTHMFSPRQGFRVLRRRPPMATPPHASTDSSEKKPLPETKKPEKLTPEATAFLAALDTAAVTKNRLVVAQTAPAVRVALSEEFGEPPGAFSGGQLVAALRALGVDKVVDTNTAADLCVCEEGTELLQRLLEAEEDSEEGEEVTESSEKAVLPMFTSCCPGWIQLVEKSMPDVWPYISSCKSPHMMLGALLKRVTKDVWGGHEPEQIYLASVMPCVRKKAESEKPQYVTSGVRDVDEVITTRDLGALLRLKGIDPANLPPEQFDNPLGKGTGAGQLFGVTGGVMEAAVRTMYAVVTEGETLPKLELTEVRGLDGVKTVDISLKSKKTGKGLDRVLRLAVVNGLNNAKELIKKMRDGTVELDFVEVMACPGGCIGGRGQPRSKNQKETLRLRANAVYKLDKNASIRQSHENPAVSNIYDTWLGPGFGSKTAKEVLHEERPRKNESGETFEPAFPVENKSGKIKEQECATCGLRYDVREEE